MAPISRHTRLLPFAHASDNGDPPPHPTSALCPCYWGSGLYWYVCTGMSVMVHPSDNGDSPRPTPSPLCPLPLLQVALVPHHTRPLPRHTHPLPFALAPGGADPPPYPPSPLTPLPLLQVTKMTQQAEEKSLAPKVVAAVVLEALTADSPRAR